MNQVITTSDGSHTIYVPEIDEHYHSIFGAIQESEHVFIKNGLDYCADDRINIFEVGFGTGLNAMLTGLSAMNSVKEICYTAIEKYPLEDEIVKVLNYPSLRGEEGEKIFGKIHDCEWGKRCELSGNFSLFKIKNDLLEIIPEGNFNLVFFDAFGPDKQPEMWTIDVFHKISDITVKGGILVTYSAKGQVRRNLEASGFKVTRIPGPPGKREMVRAVKI